MHVLWINNKASRGGGAEQYIYNTVKHLNKKGIKSSLLYDPNIEVENEFLDIFDSAFPLLCIKEQIQNINPDLLYIHQLHDYASYEEIMKSKVKKIRFYHDHKLFCLREHKYKTLSKKTCICKTGLDCYSCLGFIKKTQDGFKIASLGKLQKLQDINKRLDLFIVASSYMKEHLKLHHFEASKIMINPLYANDNVEYKNSMNINKSKTLLYVGQLVTGKGIDILLNAMKNIDKSYSLKIIGSGAQEEFLKHYAQKLKIEERVEFIGQIEHEKLLFYYQRAYCLIVPSRTPETFNLTGVEALKAGLPVIAANVGAIKEWLIHGNNGFLFESNNAQDLALKINDLISNPSLHKNFCLNAFKSTQHNFKSQTHINNLIDIFNQKLQGV
ncbi:MAG: glycosyltransferase family 4 protein [Campylobacteraceae bacterium]|nr:glycosyltransferase family 4 protein [Campylobacteraceae bacterium]